MNKYYIITKKKVTGWQTLKSIKLKLKVIRISHTAFEVVIIQY